MSWAIRYEGTNEFLKAWTSRTRIGDRHPAFVYATKKEAQAKIDSMYHHAKAGFSFLPVEVDLPVRDKFEFHNFKRGKRGAR